ncbi:MAG: hypothetical protein IKQ31_01735 [Clostridia bacterium]|nr:hypothetical protein [Clostridia bacterium]
MSGKSLRDAFRDKETRWYVLTALSFVITILFAVYNGFLGIYSHSIWNGSICVYYLFLIAIKFIILASEKTTKHIDDIKIKSQRREKVFFVLSIIIIVMNLSLILPISLMVLNEKQVEYGLIAAIVFAVYATHKITMAIINYTKSRRYENLAYKQIRTINIIDAIISVLTLQNALIMVNDGSVSGDMFTLSSITSFVGIVVIVVISVIPLVRFVKQKKSLK